ncbi:MAG: hypothetical protein IJ193_09410 [Bacilli bacterium]|nr:hypothetical protein [Bacilli bacterium]
MVQLLKGDVKRMSVDKLEINPDATKSLRKQLKETVVKKDSLFYRNFIGREINFEYDTYLCTRMEAESYLLDGTCNSILFVDYEELRESDNIDKKEFKQMKKEYKKKR